MARPVQVAPPAPGNANAPAHPAAAPPEGEPAGSTPPAPAAPAAPASASTSATLAPPAAHPQAGGTSGGTSGANSGGSSGGAVPPLPEGLSLVHVRAIRANPHQPRTEFNGDALRRLADSIKADGLMQPIIIRPLPADAPPFPMDTLPEGPPSDRRLPPGPRYEIVAGERRWRAAKLAGLNHVPAIIRTLSNRQMAEWALIENLQREDLNPLERAEAFRQLMIQFKVNHDDIAGRLGIDRSSVSNALRLLSLDESVKDLMRYGKLSGGQARALVALSDPAQQRILANKAVDNDWSVRQLEQAVRHASGATAAALEDADAFPGLPPAPPRATHFADLQEQIGRQLQTKVHIRPGRRKGSGTLTIEFHTVEQFEILMTRMKVKTSEE
ncbi:MAG: ParB/RepB/Spo0J family partition protein [Planctomycetota bacterium]|nr:ParB/RepB/Spo0J family partition protein [Planctomycetota bacterium]